MLGWPAKDSFTSRERISKDDSALCRDGEGQSNSRQLQREPERPNRAPRLYRGRRYRLRIFIGARTSPDALGVKNPRSCECGTAEGCGMLATRTGVPPHQTNSSQLAGPILIHPKQRRLSRRRTRTLSKFCTGKKIGADADVCLPVGDGVERDLTYTRRFCPLVAI